MKRKEFYSIFLLLVISCQPTVSSTDITISPTKTDVINNTVYTDTKTMVPQYIYTKTPSSTYSKKYTRTLTNTPVIIQGNGELKAYPNQDDIELSIFDLDIGENGINTYSDIKLLITCGSYCFEYIIPTNGALAFYINMEEPSYEDCISNKKLFSGYEIDDLQNGAYICLLTNLNNISILRIDNSYRADKGSTVLDIFFKTWRQ